MRKEYLASTSDQLMFASGRILEFPAMVSSHVNLPSLITGVKRKLDYGDGVKCIVHEKPCFRFLTSRTFAAIVRCAAHFPSPQESLDFWDVKVKRHHSRPAQNHPPKVQVTRYFRGTITNTSQTPVFQGFVAKAPEISELSDDFPNTDHQCSRVFCDMDVDVCPRH